VPYVANESEAAHNGRDYRLSVHVYDRQYKSYA